MKPSKMGVRWKVYIYFAIFALAILICLWLFQTVFLDDFYKTIKIAELRAGAATISKNLDNGRLEDVAEQISVNNEICLLIYDSDFNTLYTSDVLRSCAIHKMGAAGAKSYFQQAQEAGGVYMTRLNHNRRASDSGLPAPPSNLPEDMPFPFEGKGGFESESMIMAQIATTGGGAQYLVLLNSVISPVNATVQTLRMQLIIITASMLLVAFLLAVLLSRRISRPIISINNSAKLLAKGNYNVTFNDNGYKEIAELAGTLNYAAGELSKVEGLRRELLANVSHDLRTPLTMITGYSEVMRDLPGENTPENVQIIIDEAKRLTDLVNDMLDLSKIQAGELSLHRTTFNLTGVVRSIVNRYNKLAGQDGYVFRLECGADVMVNADELKISQVIYNLVNNAVNYAGRDKTITVRQKVERGRVTVEVTDTGEGIPADKLPLIWDRYYKVDKQHKRAAVGTGLGLSIVRSILDSHNAGEPDCARYGVTSAVGRGSTFWFSLKIEKE